MSLWTAHSPRRRSGSWRQSTSPLRTRSPTAAGFAPTWRATGSPLAPSSTRRWSPPAYAYHPRTSTAAWAPRWEADAPLYQYHDGSFLYWDEPLHEKHLPLEDVLDAPGLVHAWEKHHVLSWLHAVGLSDVVANFRTAKFIGEDLLRLTPKNIAEQLKLKDQTTIMRVMQQVMPLKEDWKAHRQAAGLRTKVGHPEGDRAKRLVAELHVLIEGLGCALPPGATGAYVRLELGDMIARTPVVPSGYEAWCVRRRPKLSRGSPTDPPPEARLHVAWRAAGTTRTTSTPRTCAAGLAPPPLPSSTGRATRTRSGRRWRRMAAAGRGRRPSSSR